MREDFYECSVAPEKERFQRILLNVYRVLFVILVIFFVATFYLWLLTFDSGFIFLYAFALVGGTGMFFLKRKLCMYFDYTYISGELRLIKVINGKSRKKYLIIDCKTITQIGKVGSDSFEKLEASKQYKLKVATPNGINYDKQLFYIACNVNNEQLLVILECEERLLSFIVANRGKSIIEKDYA